MLSIRTLIIVFFAATTVQALTIDMVPVGNPGNAPIPATTVSLSARWPTAYQIGKYEVTAGQYTEFLNAVAKDDPNGLYHTSMAIPGGLIGTNIQRSGSSPNFSYSVAANSADRPVNLVTFWDSVRFANWLHNGQPTGPQGPGTTEDGAYHDVGSQTLFGRNASANFFIPTEDEWYKAAYHDQTAGLAATYFDYPTGTNTVPGNDINETTNAGNNANYFNGNYAIGSPHFRSVAGEFELSDSPYGTFDQGGNVFEWNETAVTGSSRSIRGGSFYEAASATNLHASSFQQSDPTLEYFDVGFRVASTSEPDADGDFNHDGFVDAADYVVWRNDPARTQLQYDLWCANFGQTAGSGASALLGSPSNVVPEPTAAVLCGVIFGLVGLLRRSNR